MTSADMDPEAHGAPAVLLLDVGQGDASLIILPGTPRRAVVVDCNDAQVVQRHLDSYGVAHLEAVVFTHLDLDHIRGGLELVRAWVTRISNIYVDKDGRCLDESTSDYQTAKNLLDAIIAVRRRADLPGPELMPPHRGAVLAAGDGWRVRLVAPNHAEQLAEDRGGRKRTTNEHSAVVRVERDHPGGVQAVLIGGDAPLVVWADLPTKDRRAAVFRTPHHGGALDDGGIPDGWSPASLYDAVAPSDAVLSVGTTNGHGHPHPDWRAPLVARAGCHVRCTQVTPACDAALADATEAGRRRGQVLRTARLAEPPWRHLTPTGRPRRGTTHREVPCAGTVAVALCADGSVVVRPQPPDHGLIVDRWAHPWCRAGSPAASAAERDDLLDLLFAP